MIDVKQEKFDSLSSFNQLTTRPISNCEGKSFPVVQKPKGVCLIFCYISISLDGRNLLLDHRSVNLGFNEKVSMRCGSKKKTLLLSVNATIEIRCH